MRWARDNPEAYDEIARLPLPQQNEALRAAMADSIPWRGDSPAYSPPPHEENCGCEWCEP